MLTQYVHESKAVGLKTTADSGYAFVKWTASKTTFTDDTANPITFTVDGNITITPVYTIPNAGAVAAAKSAAQTTLHQFTATNATTDAEVLAAVNAAIAKTGVTAAWKSGDGKTITDFGTNNVYLTISYTLAHGEKSENVQVFYIDQDGVPHGQLSTCDENQKAAVVVVSHFSIYAVGYKAKVQVLAMQQAGILMGKDSNKFDPQGQTTRAEAAAGLTF